MIHSQHALAAHLAVVHAVRLVDHAAVALRNGDASIAGKQREQREGERGANGREGDGRRWMLLRNEMSRLTFRLSSSRLSALPASSDADSSSPAAFAFFRSTIGMRFTRARTSG